MNKKEQENQDYLNNLLNKGNNEIPKQPEKVKEPENNTFNPPSSDYIYVDVEKLPSGKFYPKGTKIAIRAAKVAEVQSFSMVDDNNFVDIAAKMNELLSRCVKFYRENGKESSYRDVKDGDRVFLVFMIRELTFQGGNTLIKETQCKSCQHEFNIPFRATMSPNAPCTFELHNTKEEIDKFFIKEEGVYELLYQGKSIKIGAPTIGIQEDFYSEIRRNVEDDRQPNVAFMKVMPFLLYDRDSITKEGIKKKMKDFKELNDIVLFQGINTVINGMTTGIKGLVHKCPECGTEVRTDAAFPDGASSIFEIQDILGHFGK